MTDIGLKSLGCFGLAVFGTGQILARFHCVGTVDELVARLFLLSYGSQQATAEFTVDYKIYGIYSSMDVNCRSTNLNKSSSDLLNFGKTSSTKFD